MSSVDAYRKQLLRIVCTKKQALAIYCGDDPQMKEVAREANQVNKIPLEDRHKILKFFIVKPLNLEAWK